MAEQSSEWSDIELESAVDAYLWMLNEETSGRSYSKAEVNRQLRDGIPEKPIAKATNSSSQRLIIDVAV